MIKKILILTTLFLLITVGGIVGAIYWQEYDLQKCNTIRDNPYYFAKNGCFTTIYKPLVNKILMFVIITILPYFLWAVGAFFYLTRADD